MGNYITVDEVAQRLGVTLTTEEQAFVENVIAQAEAFVESFTNRIWERTKTETEYVNGHPDLKTYYTKRGAISSVSSIVVSGKTLTEGTDYVVYPEYNKIVFLRALPAGYRNVVITYDWGGESLPQEVKAVLLEIVASVFERMRQHQSTGGASSLSLGGASMSFNVKDFLTPDMKEVLKIHVRWKF